MTDKDGMNAILASVSGNDIMHTLILVVCVGLCFWLLWFVLDYAKLPEPFNKVARVILMIAGVIFLINVIMSLAGHPFINW